MKWHNILKIIDYQISLYCTQGHTANIEPIFLIGFPNKEKGTDTFIIVCFGKFLSE